MEEIKKGKHKFYIGEDSEHPLAEITVVPTVKAILIERTYVSDTLKGQGVGVKLVEKVVEFAREEDKQIIASCPYAKKVIEKNKDYKDLLIEE